MRDSFLVNGVAFKKTFSYAGFEQQPKKFLNPKILLLNIELELKSEKENAEIRQDYFGCSFNLYTFFPLQLLGPNSFCCLSDFQIHYNISR